MQDASGVDLGQFKRWYEQAGTPEITVEDRWDPADAQLRADRRAEGAADAGPAGEAADADPARDGACSGRTATNCRPGSRTRAASRTGTRVLALAEPRAELSLCRRAGAAGAVAAARISRRRSSCKGVPLDRLKFLAIHDTEPFARWEAGQQVATRVLLDRIAAHQRGAELRAARPRSRRGDAAHPRRCRPRPGLCRRGADLAERSVPRRPARRRRCRRDPRRARRRPRGARPGACRRSSPRPIGRSPIRAPTASTAARSAGGRCATSASPISRPPIRRRVRRSPWRSSTPGANMTDVLAALTVLVDLDRPERAAALARFYRALVA